MATCPALSTSGVTHLRADTTAERHLLRQDTAVHPKSGLSPNLPAHVLLIQTHQRPKVFVAFKMNWVDPFGSDNSANELFW